MPAWLRACLRPFFATYIAEIEAVDADAPSLAWGSW
jgi:hypothetical protein